MTQFALRLILRANALFSLCFGVYLVLFGGQAAALLLASAEVAATWLFRAIGVGLLVFVVLLVRLSRQKPPPPREVWAIAACDGLWVAASVMLVLFAPALLSPDAPRVILGVAAAVAVFGVGQALLAAPKRPLAPRQAAQ